MTRRLLLPVLALMLGLAAAPAQATLLVRSDGAGLLVKDKNGLDDKVEIRNNSDHPMYAIFNKNPGDVFSFEGQTGCSEQNAFRRAFCTRNGPIMNIQLLAGKDSLIMESSTPVGISTITAGTGDDFVIGHSGKDTIIGGTGEDELRGESGDDTLDGSENADRLEGGNGDDTLKGEGNADVLVGDKGDDVLRGGVGNDFLNLREPDGSAAVDDAADCGTGFDAVEADLKDSIQADCEEVDRAPVGETPNVDVLGKTLRVSRTGKVNVRMRCPRGVKRLGCKGRLQLRIDRRASSSRSRKVRYRIKAGRRKTVTLKLTRRDVRSLRGRQRRGRKTRGVLTSVEKGRKGRKTTIRNPRLRLR
jgi:hemolysin type calcium-binding protein